MSDPSTSPFRRLRELLQPEHGDIAVVVVYGIAAGLLSLAVPVATQALVNTAAFGTLIQPLLVLATIVLVVLAVVGVLRALQVVVAEHIQQRLFARTAIDLAHRLPRVRLETYDRYRGTELVNRFMDVMTVSKSTTFVLLDGLTIVIQAAVGLVLLALYHPILVVFDLVLLASMAFVLVGLGRGAVRTSIDESYAKYSVLAWLEELARAPLAFRHSGGTHLALRKADDATVAYIESRQAHFRVLFRQIIGTLVVQALVSGLLLGLGGVLVARQQLTLGQLVAAELIVTPLVYRFAQLGKYLEAIYDLLAAADKIGFLFDVPLEPERGALLPEGPARVHFRSVSFGYPDRAAVLQAVQLQVEPGARVAIFGDTGSGKSSLADLVAGLRSPLAGAVELGGVDVRELSPDALRAGVELVRGVQLFDGTIEENVHLGRASTTPGDVRAVLDALGLLDELSAFPRALATPVSGTHSPLSTGQALRLTIARAVLGRPRLLVLDEVLDELDDRARGRVLDVVLDRAAPWTLLLLTRRPEVASRCPRVITLRGGVVVEGAP